MNRGWRRRWTVDLSSGTAHHESGLRVVLAVVAAGELESEITALPTDLPRGRLPRLVQEAKTIYTEAKASQA